MFEFTTNQTFNRAAAHLLYLDAKESTDITSVFKSLLQ